MNNEKLEIRHEKLKEKKLLSSFAAVNLSRLTPQASGNTHYALRTTYHALRTTCHYLLRIGDTEQIILLIIALGFALRLYTLGSESLWYDELLQLDIAQGPLETIFPRLRGHSAVPLDYLIAHVWMLLGRGDGWVRLPAVVVGTLTLPVMYQFGRRLLGRREGLLVMALLALAPFHVRYSQEVRPYALVVLGVTLAGYGFWRFWQTGRWRYFAPLQAGVLIFLLAHIFAAVIIIPLFIFLAVIFITGPGRARAARLCGALALSGLAPLAIFWWMGWGDVLFYTSASFGEALVQPDKFTANMSDQPKPVTGPDVDWPFIRAMILAPFVGQESLPALLYFYGLTGLGGFYLLARKKYRLLFLLVLWLLLPPVIITIFLIYRDTFFASRYIISIFPASLALLSAGILAGPRWLKQRGQARLSVGLLAVLLALALFNFGVGLSRYYRQQDKEQWRLVAEFVAANAGPNDAVIAFRAEPTMNWYYPRAWTAPNYYQNLASVQQAVAGSERSWVILSIFSSGADAKIKAWLSEQQAVRFVLDPVIHVYYLGHNIPHDQLLAEIQNFALPVDHALYASLARENRRRPEVARQYYHLAIQHAPSRQVKAEYQAALDALR